MTNGSLRYGHSIRWQSVENTWPLAKSQAAFLPTLYNAKMENMQSAVAVNKVWLQRGRTPGSSWESQPRNSWSRSWPAQPSSVLTPKLWEWPSGGPLVLLIGVSEEHGNPPPTLHWRRDCGAEGERDSRGLCSLRGGKQDFWTSRCRMKQMKMGCRERKALQVN